ncbi:MAG: ribosome hibernation factor-recruiting GTPase MRF [Pseudonocardia sp.]
MTGTGRAELIVLAGGVTGDAAVGAERVIARIRAEDPGTAVLHHDLAQVTRGVVVRRLRLGDADRLTLLELAHGCVSCTLREDILPMLRELGRRPGVNRIVLHLDPALEPDQVCGAILAVLVNGTPVTDAVDLRGVVTVLDVGSWLADATGSDELDERGLAELPGDERTIAQLVVGQAEVADLLVYAGTAEGWLQARTGAVLARLTPLARRLSLGELDSRLLLRTLPLGARRGRPESAHAPLLRGQPPLDPCAGVQLLMFTARRPFHPERLHEAVDVLLDGVVRTRGRVWLASRPDAVLWLESAGGGLQVGYAGDWLAAGGAEAWQRADPERHAQAALRWHARWGDRAQDLSILVSEADVGEIDTALRRALLTDEELVGGEQAWSRLPDPFGWWHTDPCDDIAPQPIAELGRPDQDGRG